MKVLDNKLVRAGLVFGMLTIGGEALSGCAVGIPKSERMYWEDLNQVAQLRKALKSRGELKGVDVGDHYRELRDELWRLQETGKLSKDITVIDLYRMKEEGKYQTPGTI